MKVLKLFMLAALLPMLMLTGCKSDDDDMIIWEIYLTACNYSDN